MGAVKDELMTQVEKIFSNKLFQSSNAAPSMCLSENKKLRKQDYTTTPKHEGISEVG